jgi:hypothetical protein
MSDQEELKRDSDCLRVIFEDKGIKVVCDFEPGIAHDSIKKLCYKYLEAKMKEGG